MNKQIEQIKAEIERRYNDNLKAIELIEPESDDFKRISSAIFGAAAKEDYDLISFIEELPEEPVSEDLEAVADIYAEKHGFRVPYDGSNNFYDTTDVKASKEGFIAGVNWQKEQMIKDAIGGQVVGGFVESDGLIGVHMNLRDGDKVKLIVLKN